MRKFYIILLIVLGFFLIPEKSFACGSHHKEGSSVVSCNSGKHDLKKEGCKGTVKHSHGCKSKEGGKCDGFCCSCVSAGNYKFLPLSFSETLVVLKGPIPEKQGFGYAESCIEADHCGLRLPPKIS